MIPSRARRGRRVLRALAIALLAPVAVAGAYVAYFFMDYHRLQDGAEQHSQNVNNRAPIGVETTVVTWNIGFGAYHRDFSFFMDGGTSGRADSQEAVAEAMDHIAALLKAQAPDHLLLQEVDTRADRSWFINELDMLRAFFPQHQSYFARNYNSPYIIFPLNQPHGKAQSGLLTLSDRDIYRGERHTLPVEEGLMRVLDLDRCYTLSRIPTENGRQLCLYNLHLSAYTSDGTVATQQLEKLTADMLSEYRKGNYCVAGGDFNKDLLGHSDRIFGVAPREGLTWNQPIERDLIPEGLKLVESLDKRHPVPTCRDCDTGYVPGQTFVVTVDGFIVSDNVRVTDCRVIDDGFTASDHNPVKLTFQLIEETEDLRYELGPYTALSGY